MRCPACDATVFGAECDVCGARFAGIAPIARPFPLPPDPSTSRGRPTIGPILSLISSAISGYLAARTLADLNWTLAGVLVPFWCTLLLAISTAVTSILALRGSAAAVLTSAILQTLLIVVDFASGFLAWAASALVMGASAFANDEGLANNANSLIDALVTRGALCIGAALFAVVAAIACYVSVGRARRWAAKQPP